MPPLHNALRLFKCDTDHRISTTYHQSLNPQQVFGKCIIQSVANVMATTGTLRWYTGHWRYIHGTNTKLLMPLYRILLYSTVYKSLRSFVLVLWMQRQCPVVGILMLDGDFVLGPITGIYYSLFQNEISNIPIVAPSLFNQTRRITRHNVSVTRYKSVTKNGHDWSPASTLRL